jgi:hypothetical protein
MRVSMLSFVALALISSACSRSAPPAAPKPVVTPAKAPTVSLPVIEQPAAPAPPPGAFAGEALARMLTCGDPAFLALPIAQQSQALQTEPRLHCQPPSGADTLSCTPAEPVSAFGSRVLGFSLNHANGGHGLGAQLEGDMPALLQGMAQVYPKPAHTALFGQLLSLSPDDSIAVRARETGQSGQVDFDCRIAAPGELLFVTMNEPMTDAAPMLSTTSAPAITPASKPASKTTTSTLPAGTSAIAGHIEFPGESIPALHVCAISGDTGAGACVHTQREQSRYRIENLPAGNYQVWAWLAAPEGDMQVMRAAHAVQCIRAPCPPQLRNIELPADTKVDGMTLNDAAASYPDQPPEPGG